MANAKEARGTILLPEVKFISDPDKPEDIQGVIAYANNYTEFISGLGRPDQVLFNLDRKRLLISASSFTINISSFVVAVKGFLNLTGALNTITYQNESLPYLLSAVTGVAEIAVGTVAVAYVNHWYNHELNPLNLLRERWVKKMNQITLDSGPTTPVVDSETPAIETT